MLRSGGKSRRLGRATSGFWKTASAATSAIALGFILSTGPALAASFEFVAFGDMPYNDDDQMERLHDIGAKAQNAGVPFVIHYGDIKGGGEPCTNALLLNRLAVIQGVLPGRVFMTPGDNDWTDCDRDAAGGYDELERLAFIRRSFISDPAFDARFDVRRQEPDYLENAIWGHEAVVFATLHVVGTDNGRRKIGKSDKDAAYKAVEERDAANLKWLDKAFGRARKTEAKAVVIVFHTDPTDFKHTDKADRPCSEEHRKKCNPYKTLVDRLRAHAGEFEKPVLLIHGSTTPVCVDKGFGGFEAPNLWRLNGPGDFVVVDAAVVTFRTNRTPAFEARLLLSGHPIPELCL